RSSVLDSVYPRSFKEYSLSFSQLTFMDDSTLVSSSKDGLASLLSITEEFYELNNPTANHAKYVLLSSELSEPTNIVFSLSSSPLVSTQHLSFRFLDYEV